MGAFGGEPTARHCTYSIEFKRQVAQEYLGGESLNGLARRYDVSRNLIRVWIAMYEAGAFDDEFQAADLLRPARVAVGEPNRCSREYPTVEHLVHGRPRDAQLSRYSLDGQELSHHQHFLSSRRRAGTGVEYGNAGRIVEPARSHVGAAGMVVRMSRRLWIIITNPVDRRPPRGAVYFPT